MNITRQFIVLSLVLLCFAVRADSATQPADAEAAYRASIRERAAKIVQKLDISDSAKADRVTDIIAQQYVDLRDLHAARDAKLKADGLDDAQKQVVKDESQAAVKALHHDFLAKLSTELSPDQLDGVKNGMTYNVLNVTYTAYCEMIPTLNDEQKEYIKTQLTEARELAMDGGSSNEKHAIFGKYKGRINNYLSKAGYNLKEEEARWRERRNAATQKN